MKEGTLTSDDPLAKAVSLDPQHMESCAFAAACQSSTITHQHVGAHEWTYWTMIPAPTLSCFCNHLFGISSLIHSFVSNFFGIFVDSWLEVVLFGVFWLLKSQCGFHYMADSKIFIGSDVVPVISKIIISQMILPLMTLVILRYKMMIVCFTRSEFFFY